jgi:hypothetical protein
LILHEFNDLFVNNAVDLQPFFNKNSSCCLVQLGIDKRFNPLFISYIALGRFPIKSTAFSISKER